MTPHRYMVDIHAEFTEDLRAAEVPDEQICARAWFAHVFAYHPELKHVTIASGKENFGRCTLCAQYEEEIKKARASGKLAPASRPPRTGPCVTRARNMP